MKSVMGTEMHLHLWKTPEETHGPTKGEVLPPRLHAKEEEEADREDLE